MNENQPNYFAVIGTRAGRFITLTSADQARGHLPSRLCIFGTPVTDAERDLQMTLEAMAVWIHPRAVHRFLSICPGDVKGVTGLSADVRVDEIPTFGAAEPEAYEIIATGEPETHVAKIAEQLGVKESEIISFFEKED